MCISSIINPYTMERATELINSKQINVSVMQCEPISLEELERVLSDKEMRKKGKWVVRFGE